MHRLKIEAPTTGRRNEILSVEALAFVADLCHHFDPARRDLLAERERRQADLDAGVDPTFLGEGGLDELAVAREGDWKVAPAPADLDDRRVEITGPVDRKMVINALNSGARAFMADFEDASSPTWDNMVDGQVNLADAVRRRIDFTSPEGKSYALAEETATLLVRPRGWHLDERHATLGGEPVSASLFDFGLYFFHNAGELVARGSGPYFYLPKLESHQEARLWNEVFLRAQKLVGLPAGTVRATVLLENVLAAFEMEEILYELRQHSAGFNAGRWDYIFSCIKKFRSRDEIFPDRGQVTMTVPFMRAYTERLVAVCHRRGAHAIGGMAAFIPNRRQPEVTERAIAKVRADKELEASAGFDGTWVAHPDLVPVAMEVFARHLGNRPHQKHRLREEVEVAAGELIDFRVDGGEVTEDGVRQNVSVALQYVDGWLQGVGAVAIENLMEDAATAEISRSQLWQWVHRGAVLSDGRTVDAAMYRRVRDEELERLGGKGSGRLGDAAEVLDEMVLAEEFVGWLTVEAYGRLG
jgi:malate synthase